MLSATVQRPPPGAFDGAPGSSSLTQLKDSSISPYLSNSALVIETIGEGPNAKTDFFLPESNSSDPEYTAFEYPGIDDNLLGATDADVQCRASLGENITRFSCNEALNSMSTDNTRFSWGQRFTQQAWQVKLPVRYSGSDGFCVIDVTHAKGKVSDFATPREVKEAAQKVVNGCIKTGKPNTGGSIRKVGKMNLSELL